MRTVLCLMLALAICIPAHSQEQDAPIDHRITRTTSVINKAADGTLTVTPYTLNGDPRSPVYKKALAQEEDKLEQLQAEVMRQPVRVRLAPERLVCGQSQNFAQSLEHCNQCNTSCSSSCSRCSDNCSRGTSCSRSCSTYCSRTTAGCSTSCSSCSRGSSCSSCSSNGPPTRGYYCNCANHIANCQRRGLNWRSTPCTCPPGSMPGEGGGRSCCNP